MQKNNARGKVSEFIRRHKAVAPAEIVKLGAAAGLKFSASTVYSVRSQDLQRAKKLTVKPAAKKNGAASIVHSEGLEGQLRRAIAELGLSRSRQVFQHVESSFAQPAAPQ